MILAQKRIFWFASIFVSLVIVDCWIIRKSCVQEADFSNIIVGYALDTHVIATFSSLNLAQCKENCVDDFRCRSINHANDNSVCELNDQIAELPTPAFLKIKSGWTYHSTNHAVRNIGPVCRHQNPCPLTSYCMDICYCPGYQCVAMPNVALRRPAEQAGIHTYKGLDHVPSFANDGNRDNTHTKCGITTKAENSYWLVDLGSPYLVQTVAVLSSKDWGQTKINPFKIRVGYNKANGGKNNPVCAENLIVKEGKMKTVECVNKFGRYVSLNKGNKEYVVYCEVEVYGMVV